MRCAGLRAQRLERGMAVILAPRELTIQWYIEISVVEALCPASRPLRGVLSVNNSKPMQNQLKASPIPTHQVSLLLNNVDGKIFLSPPIFFSSFGCPAAHGGPRPEIRSEPHLPPMPKLWQHWIL